MIRIFSSIFNAIIYPYVSSRFRRSQLGIDGRPVTAAADDYQDPISQGLLYLGILRRRDEDNQTFEKLGSKIEQV